METISTNVQTLDLQNAGDNLLATLSTRGQMPICRVSDRGSNSFEDAASILLRSASLAHQRVSVWELAGAFSELGFAEIEGFGSASGLYVAAPVLARLPAQNAAVLCGARTPHFLQQFLATAQTFGTQICGPQMSAAVAHPHQITPLLPAPIILRAQNPAAFEQIAKALPGVSYSEVPAAWLALCVSPSISEFAEICTTFISQNESQLNAEWFDTKNNLWKALRAAQRPSGPIFFGRRRLYGTQYFIGRYEGNTLRTAAVGAELFDDKWAKWLVIQQTSTPALMYDRERQRLAIPRTCPLPTLLARAFALCSGNPAQIWARELVRHAPPDFPRSDLKVYTEVPEAFAQVAATKLQTRLEKAVLETPEESLRDWRPHFQN